ncbi:DUF3626 domain-containing protein [Paractinoplanes rishiriensis]|uniref:DUF3626 domain-containing protein n=1 Tax=Paractinoplanes rishiriensis TaxID=1050105 RepID=A0A919N273_9ACTN|nr:DUF3626 domain-containing protein [Actinoplanes rishiriensis]GIE98797.1 hypothetical protein Ari01nite_62620 [Actinoplanes rishiriensis]
MTSPAERAVAHVRGLFPEAGPPGLFDRAVITVSFHPDRLVAGGRTVAECLVAEGVYRSQFETGISNGGLDGVIGGRRTVWEQRMFGGAYVSPSGRPIYGGLNLAGHPDGASPRFGSCHLVLRPEVSQRATFSHGDSVTEPSVVGTAVSFGAVWAALLDEVSRTGRALNVAAASAGDWVRALAVPRRAPGRALDDYVEAQVHGGVTLGADVTAVVADPSFRGTRYEELLGSLAPALDWSPGFRLPATGFPASLRGPDVPPLALEIADRYGTPVLDAEVIGRAAREPGTTPERLQLIKYLWHILVLNGAPIDSPS